MNKGIILAAALATGMGLGITTWAAAGGLQAPTAPITIEGKKPAKFNHATHTALGLACGTCHHDAAHKPRTAEAIAALPDAKQLACETCHNEKFANPKLRKRMDVFHARCKECHQAGVNGKKGPTGCSGCHVTQKKKAIEGC
ncbi:MAG: cytochrome c3 family protein [Desulfobacteraceae bacterium]|nr:cytochrome c3 family protein [Desulfobacteraceae bacterium]